MSKTIILMLIACLLAACAPSQQAVEAAVRWRRGLGGGSIGAGTPYNIIISQ